ncbi:MAG: tetratricopeptide repeat protein [Elusimicrobiota bacterium]
MKDATSVAARRSAGRRLLGPLLLLSGVLIVYGRSLPYDFVYDDQWTIVQNPSIRPGVPLRRFFSDAGTVALPAVEMGKDVYRPLPTLSFLWDFRAWGLRPFWYRLENLLLHALNGGLLFLLLTRRLRLTPAAGAAGSALFLFHPAQVESVVWVTQRSNLLCLAGLLGAFLLATGSRKISPARLWAGAACFAAALLSKETAAVFPVLLFLADAREAAAEKRRPRWALHAGALALTLAYLVLRRWAVGRWGQAVWPLEGTADRFFLAGRVWWEHLSLALLPLQLTVSHRLEDGRLLANPRAWAGLAALVACAWAARTAWRTGLRRAAFGISWGILALAPNLGLVPTVTFAAERFLYVPLAGAAVLAAALWDRAGKGRTAARAALIGAAVVWAGAAAARTGDWKNDVTLWRSAVRADPENLFARACLAEAHQSSGSPDDARREYRTILQGSSPEHLAFAAMNNLARLENQAGRPEEGLRWAEKALSLRPRSPQTLYNAAVSLGLLGRRNEALRAVDRGEEAEPGHARWAELRRKLADREAGGAP